MQFYSDTEPAQPGFSSFIGSALLYSNLARHAAWTRVATKGFPGITGLRWLGEPGRSKWFNPIGWIDRTWRGNPLYRLARRKTAMGRFMRQGFGGVLQGGTPGTWANIMGMATGPPTAGGLRYGTFQMAGYESESKMIRQSLQKMSAKRLFTITEAEANVTLGAFNIPLTKFYGGAGMQPSVEKVSTSLIGSARLAGVGKVVGGVLGPLNYALWGKLAGDLAISGMRGVGMIAGTLVNQAQGVVGRIRTPEFGSGGLAMAFQTNLALTERQRSIQEIGRHNLNARSLMGNEAAQMMDIY